MDSSQSPFPSVFLVIVQEQITNSIRSVRSDLETVVI